MRRLLALVTALLWLSVARMGRAELPHDCNSPRHAVESVFAWQQPWTYDATKAAMCLDAPGKTASERAEIAEHIKTLYDARGLYVRVTAIADDPTWVDPGTGLSEVVPHTGLPDVVVARSNDGKWRWTEPSIDRVEALYAQNYSLLERTVVKRLPRAFKQDVFGIHVWQYLALFVLVLLALAARSLIRFVVKGRVKHLVEHLGQQWAARLVDVFASPGATLLMAIMLRVAYPALRLPGDVELTLGMIVRLLVVLSLVWAAYRLVDVVSERMSARAALTESKLDDQLIPLVRKSLKLLTALAGSLVVLQNAGVDVGSLLAGLGIGGVAVALAAKDTIANFFGSVMIFVDQPFQIGDYVAVAGVEGTVEEVGFRSTRIRTPQASLVTVPNAKFTEANIDNLGRRAYRRTALTLSVAYETSVEQLEAFCEGVRGVILANPYTRKDNYEVHVSALAAKSIDVMLVFFLQVDNWSRELEERHNVLLEVLRVSEAVAIRFWFPAQLPGSELRPPPPPADLVRAVADFAPEGERSRPVPPSLVDGAHLARKRAAAS